MECTIKNIEAEEDDSDILDSDSESGSAVFQIERNIVSSTEKDIMTNIILHNQSKLTDKLDLKNVILLDNQSTLYLICNKKLTSKIKKSDKKISVKGNRGTLTINYKSRIPGYNYYTWYRKDEISNIISLRNMIRRYRVTYDINNHTLIVHRESSALLDMEFRMHKSGIHVFYREEINNLVLMNTVEENMNTYTKRDVEGAKSATKLYTKLSYP